ncbi:non-ribosomal peptide synthetase [Drechmeria coniospora]|uniref:Non-ribosomal peptide synthetase n=1 Tax=Drechmeria coniospora TaxID=98403 RepID=A0A151GT63_DRECN|nr:non-ribosomal peptide synthetase [Drechmeria coniospora]KYK60268.1 non-ribosomal peptide synthetase [Drechmeria coniospora]
MRRSLDHASSCVTEAQGPWTLDHVWAANSFVPEAIEACVHSLIKRVVCQKPASIAIRSRDGDLTYSQLDRQSSNLAYQLLYRGVRKGTTAVLCFDDSSLLAPIAALAVSKTGAALMALDITMPHDQLQPIMAQVQSPLFISSADSAHIVRRFGADNLLLIDHGLLSESTLFTLKPLHELPVVSPLDILYLAFTSGFSPNPESGKKIKGAAVTHQNVSSAAVYQQHLGSIFTNTFCSYDSAPPGSYLAWSIFFYNLIAGSCLCLPGAVEQSGQVEPPIKEPTPCTIVAMAQMLDPSKTHDLLQHFGTKIQSKPVDDEVVPDAESIPQNEALEARNEASELILHPGPGILTWVVDVVDPNILSPIGAVGELCLEGPLLGQDHLSTSDRISSSRFWRDPCWLLRGSDAIPGRYSWVYRTGVLARYLPDGRLAHVGYRPLDNDKDSDASSSQNDSGLDLKLNDDEIGINMQLSLGSQSPKPTPSDLSDGYVLMSEVDMNLSDPNLGPEAPLPFSLLDPSMNKEELVSNTAHICHVSASQIVDMMPCTPLQEGLIALTTIRPGDYVAKNEFEIGEKVDVDKLRLAWNQTVATNPILRTRVVSLPISGVHVLLQVVLDDDISWNCGEDQRHDEEQEAESERPMGLGTRLTRLCLAETAAGVRRLTWEIHHALYDGWSLPLLLKEVENAYFNRPSLCLQPMATFIKHILSRNEAAESAFWQAYFQNTNGSQFPPEKPGYHAQPDSQITSEVSGLAWGHGDYTPATIVRAAWAVAIANALGSDEALFGATVTGRQAPLAGIEIVAGPTIATVPVRVSVNWDARFDNLLNAVQREAADMIPYEQTGLSKISRISDDSAIGCKFQSLLVVQPADGDGVLDEREPFLTEVVDGESLFTSDTYAIVVECQLGSDSVDLRIAFDSSIVSRNRMDFVTQNFEFALRQLSDTCQGKLRLRCIQDELWDLHQAWAWNDVVPEAFPRCIHDIFSQRASEKPLSPAVNAWDGDFTYKDLDELSSGLALHLVDTNVAGKIVPLLFEKSKWMSVAVLAVMKAGGGCLALDSKQPLERLRSIVRQVDAPLILSSIANQSISSQLEISLSVTVGSNYSWESTSSTFPMVSPSDVLYVNFTSGSTGVPKGAVVTHGNFSSAIEHQQRALGFSCSSRVFDFSSYSFDAAWCNSLQSFTSGGCLCVPSQEERDNDLDGCFEKYKVNTVDLTPSVARIISRPALARLSTLILGGEAVLPGDPYLSTVGSETKVFNVYGPAECTPTATFAEMTPENMTIGRGAGVCAWVIDPESQTPSRVGAVGELWLEGPIVGKGYLNDAVRTEKVFIENPPWLVRGIPDRPGRTGRAGRRGRLYRTGDLVRHNDDGTLIFVGRADTQVKIRGQRVELGDVERHVLDALVLPRDLSARVTAETIRPKQSNSTLLVAFITLENAAFSTEESHDIVVKQATDGLTRRLQDSIPSYLVPVAFIPLSQLPIMASGKVDRKSLQAVAEETYLQYRTVPKEKGRRHRTVEPLTEIEAILQKIWMSVLNLTVDETSITGAFARLGGDSITAMQIISQCKLHNIVFSVSDLLDASTIKNLATRCIIASPADLVVDEDDDRAEPFDLSPIQHMFFNAYPEGLNHWNQSFLLELARPVSVTLLEEAVNAVVRRHAMLRCRFQKDPETGYWFQHILEGEDAPSSFAFTEHLVEKQDQIITISQARQESLDIQHGPVFACDLFQTFRGQKQILLLSAHHAVIDLVSWRIIWGDIEDYVSHGTLLSHPTASFRQWCRRQAKIAATLSPTSVLPVTVPQPQLEFWGFSEFENTFTDCQAYTKTLDNRCSGALFGSCNDALHSQPIDIIIGALLHSFVNTFPEREPAAVWVEGHGREHSEGLPDVASTVGWFTTLHPLALPVTIASSVIDAVTLAKDTRKRIPNKGQPYFSCRYLSESGRKAFDGQDISELTLNFTGQFQQLESDDGLFKRPDDLGGEHEGDMDLVEMSPLARRFTLIEINAEVEQGQLEVTFQVHKKMKHQKRLADWTEMFAQTLISAIDELLLTAPTMTLSDLPLLPLSYKGLDTLLNQQLPRAGIQLADVVDMYPCSPLQEGILISAQKEAASYATFSVWRCVPPSGSAAVSASQLGRAWKAVTKRHTILQSVFCIHPEGKGFIQVVLAGLEPRITFHVAAEGESPREVLSRLERPSFGANEAEHAFSICQSATGEVACRLDVSHSLIDASSMTCLVGDIINTYQGVSLAPATPFMEMVRYISKIPKAQRIASWEKLLRNVQPCVFPISRTSQQRQESFNDISISHSAIAGVADFCKDMGITRSVFMQVAWSMVLSQYTCKKEVCFGYLANGRDAPVDGIEAMVGPLVNLLISRVDLGKSAKDVLQTTSQNSIKHLRIQHTSLAEIQHHLGFSERLFNTAISIRGSDKTGNLQQQTLSFEPYGGEDPHEFDIGLNAIIDGNIMDVVVDYREPYITRHVAQEAASVLTKAIRYLLTTTVGHDVDADDAQQSLFDGFFKALVGEDELATREFWQSQFTNMEGSHFPVVRAGDLIEADKEVNLHLKDVNLRGHGDLTPTTIVRAAWALLASCMTGTNEGLFGVSAEAVGTVVPVRVLLDPQSTVGGYLHAMQRQTEDMARFERTGLCWISSMSEEAAQACEFQTVIQVMDEGAEGNQIQSTHPCAIFLSCKVGMSDANICLRFDSDVLGEQQAMRLGFQLEHLLHQLLDVHLRCHALESLSLVARRDLEQIWDWNGTVPEPLDACVHELVAQVANQQPDAPAVCAWDGDLSYRQVDELSTKLAMDLVRLGVGSGTIVPLLFEKSMWMPVAALAVMKAGAGAVATDTASQPEERLWAITQQTKARVCLSSVTNESLASRLGADVVVVGPDRLRTSPAGQQLPKVSPDDLLYVIFTSGTTGTPKGAMVSHRNFSSAMRHQREALGYEKGTRVLDFSSYAFDVFWSNMLNALTAGGCFCIPSTEQRQDDLSGTLRKYAITLADFTPTIARHIRGLESVSTLVLGGEVVLASDRDLANEDARVRSAYGPAECTPTATIQNLTVGGRGGLGRGAGVCTWVVDPDKASRLMPVGAPGELWLEGALVGSGYLNDEERTATAFVQDPEWLVLGVPGRRPGRHGRLYRTGDVVQYADDGSLHFIGRKDTQVKLHGQRIELEEVERAVKKALQRQGEAMTNAQVVAEVVEPQGTGAELLAAFVRLGGPHDAHDDDAVKQATVGIRDELRAVLPPYMVPSLYVPLETIPRMPTGKVDRRQLRAAGSRLTGKDLAALSRVTGEWRAPRTGAERRVQELWAEITKVGRESIGIDDSFFRIGGDSLGAMRLVGLAHDRGVPTLTVRDVFQKPILRDLAALDIWGDGVSLGASG